MMNSNLRLQMCQKPLTAREYGYFWCCKSQKNIWLFSWLVRWCLLTAQFHMLPINPLRTTFSSSLRHIIFLRFQTALNVKARMLYKLCYSAMTKGPHLNAGCFLTLSIVNNTLPSCEPLRTSTAGGRCTSYIVDVPAVKLSTGAHWMSLIALACAAVCF